MDGRPALPAHTASHTLGGRLRRTDTKVLLGEAQQAEEDGCGLGEQQPSVTGSRVPRTELVCE
jgi:hypothetical protein